jgi:hypothetical protein
VCVCVCVWHTHVRPIWTSIIKSVPDNVYCRLPINRACWVISGFNILMNGLTLACNYASTLCISCKGRTKENTTNPYKCETYKRFTISDADAIYTILKSICGLISILDSPPAWYWELFLIRTMLQCEVIQGRWWHKSGMQALTEQLLKLISWPSSTELSTATYFIVVLKLCTKIWRGYLFHYFVLYLLLRLRTQCSLSLSQHQ